ncbi:MAG TPA: IS66 family transposase, partial [Actinomycetes bacterium]|nr:IS66 family transposase [Actinomycetes bacterium]
MPAMSEPPRELAALSVEELRAALGRQRAINTELRTVVTTQAELHQAELAARDAQIAQLRSQVAATGAQVASLTDRVAQLERQAGRDSSNSSKPPSSDSPYTKKPRKATDRSLRGRSGRKPGKQPGAPGVTLAQVADPDHTIVCAPASCAGCGCDLAGVAVAAQHTRQVFEVPPPPPRPIVTAYLVQARVCPACGTTSIGQAPAGVGGRVQYGPGVRAHAANLTCANHIPVGRAAGLLSDLLGVGCSVGFVAGVRGMAASRLGPFMERVRELLQQAGVLGVDETPARAGGGLAYVHVACTGFLTHLHTGGRSATDIDAGGVLPGFAGTIMRDGYAGYAHLSDALHAWCGAHSLRDLRAVWEADPAGQAWAGAMADLLVYANRAAGAARAAGAQTLDEATLQRIVEWYRGAVAMGIADNQRRRTQLATDGLRLARRFAAHEAMILRFATDLTVDFTNNQSERDVRPVKVQQRASGGCWRTLEGLADFAV